MTSKEIPKILAPVGDFAGLNAAIKAGCDEVYFGVAQLNMRALSAKNFEIKDLPEIVAICKKDNIKTNLALNTLLYNHDMKICRTLLEKAKKAGVDAVIISDIAAMQIAKELGMEIHISTQLSISNYETIKFYSQFSNRVVLARELILPQIKEISEQIAKDNLRGPQGRIMEIECFCHGAMCIAISGRCFMSLYEFNKSANRGACQQSCRRIYTLTDKETGHKMDIDNEYILSPEDMCTVDILDQLIDAGINVLKIEGRAKSPEYIFTVVHAYRQALDAIKIGEYTMNLKQELLKCLNRVFNRGLSPGFYLGKPVDQMAKKYGNKSTEEKIFLGTVIKNYPKVHVAQIILECDYLEKGEKIGIIGDKTGYVEQQAYDIIVNDNTLLTKAVKGDSITIKLNELVHEKDKLYVFRKRTKHQGEQSHL